MQFLAEYNLEGLVIGLLTFLIIGIFHPLVIKGEYYFGTRCWWAFFVFGVVALIAALCIENVMWSAVSNEVGSRKILNVNNEKSTETRKARCFSFRFGLFRSYT